MAQLLQQQVIAASAVQQVPPAHSVCSDTQQARPTDIQTPAAHSTAGWTARTWQDTAAIVLWAVLHYACCCCSNSSSSSSSDLVKLFPADSSDWELMCARIMSSLSPSKLLVFYLNFAEQGLRKLQCLEADLEWEQILALRLLYGVLSPQLQRTGYADFLNSMDGPLLQNLKPSHVAAFIREQAGFSPSEQLMMIWVVDEAQAFEVSSQPTNSAPHITQLLSAFVDFRVQCFVDKAPTLPICVTASTLWSRTLLLQIRSQHATITDLQLLLLSAAHCKCIFNDVCKRIRQWQQQHQQQGQQQGLERSQAQLHISDYATTVVCEQTQWPAFELQPSPIMDDADDQLPEVTKDMLQLAGGIPCLLSSALAAIAGGLKDTRIRADMLLPWQLQPPDNFNAARKLLITSACADPRWQGFQQQPGRQLLEVAFSYDMYQEPVLRTSLVNLPPGCSSSTVLAQTTWERGEQDGLWLLMAADGRRQWLSDGGKVPDLSDDGDNDGIRQYYVRVSPLLMAAFPPTRTVPSVISLPVLLGDVAWRQRGQQDVGVLSVRCLVANQVFGQRTISLMRLLKCRQPSERGRAGLLGQELWLPQQNSSVHVIRDQLTASAFDERVEAYLQDSQNKPFAFVGPGNMAADGWLVLHKPLYDSSGTAVGPGEPFIIYTASKRRRNRETISAANICKQKEKDVISTTYKYV